MNPISQRCTVCKHDQADDINSKLIAGASSRELAEQYGLGYKSIQNHKNTHLPKQLVKAKDLQEEQLADQLLARVQDLYDKSLLIIEKADSDKKWTAATGAIREARASLELVAKLVGQLRTATVNIHYNAEFIAAKLSIYEALKRFPEARAAVVTALNEEDTIDVEYKAIDSPTA